MLDEYPKSGAHAPHLIEVDVLRAWPSPAKPGDADPWAQAALRSRDKTDYFLLHQEEMPLAIFTSENEKTNFNYMFKGLKVFTVYRAIIAVDPGHADTSRLMTKDHLAELNRRIGEFYGSFPSAEFLKGVYQSPQGKRKHAQFAKLFLDEESEWPGRALLPNEGHWSPGNEIQLIDTAPARYSAVSVTLENLVTTWQNDCGVPYENAPGAITRVWLWHDTWWDREVPNFLSHLQWRSELENVRTGLPVWTVINTTEVKPAEGIDWLTKTSFLKPHLITIRPPVPEDLISRPKRPDLPLAKPTQPSH